VQADPDLILLADTECCQQDAASVAARDGWGGMKAVANGTVIELSDDVASRWGPRIVELLRAIDEAAAKAA
jgi:iron complex transport system substrate-binding protein